jgi:RNA polymerase sigma factor (TIGR02999 family)
MSRSSPSSASETLPTRTTVTRLLDQVQRGDRAALNELYPLVYHELRSVARAHRRRWHGDETLGTTALVHEAYLKLAGQENPGTESRAHFLAVAGKAMRHVLSNYARARRSQKRGGQRRRIPLDALETLPDAHALSDEAIETAAALEGALTQLEQENARLSMVVDCRFFGGMSIADTAIVLGTSPATVKRDWTLARGWLYRALQRERAAVDADG